MVRTRAVPAAAALAATAVIAGCSGPVGQGSVSQSRARALDAAAACIRAHGIPAYSDPIVTPDGQVYTDAGAFNSASQATLRAISVACRTVLVRSGLNPNREPAAPAALVQAGVRTAECERAHGMPDVTDPTARTLYTPGHGFVTGQGIPAGGKASPGFTEALRECQSQIDAEVRASTLGSLGSGG
jgi:hypothetical protein